MEHRPITKAAYDEHIRREREIKGYITATTIHPRPKVINHVINYYGRDIADSRSVRVKQQVRRFVDDVWHRVLQDDNSERFVGTRHPVGSSAERVKVGLPDEFDYIVVLNRSADWITDSRDMENIKPETFKPRKTVEPDGNQAIQQNPDEVDEKSFFRITFANRGVPAVWDSYMKCINCQRAGICNNNHPNRYLSPRAVQDRLYHLVKNAVTAIMRANQQAANHQAANQQAANQQAANQQAANPQAANPQAANPQAANQQAANQQAANQQAANQQAANQQAANPQAANQQAANQQAVEEAYITRSGPAVTCYTKITEQDQKDLVISIDLTVAFQIERTGNNSAAWPFGNNANLQLETDTQVANVNRCWLVPAGDFWRLSFVLNEKDKVRNIHPENKTCLRAVKRLRDELSLTDEYEYPALSSYPLKVSFLKEHRGNGNLELGAPSWRLDEFSEKSFSILARVETECKETGQKSFFIQNDAVSPGGDGRAYIETRRITQHLDQFVESYYKHGCVHVLLFCLMIFTFCSLIILSAVYLGLPDDMCVEQMINKGSSVTPSPNASVDWDYPCLIWYSPLHFALSVSSLVIPLFGLCIVGTGSTSQMILYELFKSIRTIYVTLVFPGLAQMAAAIAIMIIYYELDQTFPALTLPIAKDKQIIILAWFTIAVSLAVMLLIMFHAIMVLGFHRTEPCCSGPQYEYQRADGRRGRRRYGCCQIVFFEWSEVYGCCCRCCRVPVEPPPDTPLPAQDQDEQPGPSVARVESIQLQSSNNA